MSCWTKMALGWISPKTPAYGVNTISDSSSTPDCFLIGDGEFGFPHGEYLLIENRQPKGLDATLLQGGLAIYHVDEYARFNNEGYPGQNNWPRNGRHYRVALLAADGNYDLERRLNYGDAIDFFHSDGVHQLLPSDNDFGPYPNTDSYQYGKIEQTNVQIFDISKSNDTMTFTFTDGTVVLPTLSPTTSDSPTGTFDPAIRHSFYPAIRHSFDPAIRSSFDPAIRNSFESANSKSYFKTHLILHGTKKGSPRGLRSLDKSHLACVDRQSCRINYGAEVVISNVLPFLDKVCLHDYYSED
jgi:hypothetical protein